MIVITKTDLRKWPQKVEDLLLSGESLILTSYGKAICILDPDIPDDVRAKLRVKTNGSFSYTKL